MGQVCCLMPNLRAATCCAGGETDGSSSPPTSHYLARSSGTPSLTEFEPMAASFVRPGSGGLPPPRSPTAASEVSSFSAAASGSGSFTRQLSRQSMPPPQPQLSAALLAAKAVGSPHTSRVRLTFRYQQVI